jgi:hypothetical protein
MNSFKESCLLTSPKGLGYSNNSEFEQLGNTFVENNRKIEKKDPSGTIYFKDYDKCKEFIDFVESSEKLRWIYIIPFENTEKTYYRDVSIKEFEKTEKQSKMLACPVTFNGLSLWYEENTVIYTIEPLTNEMRWDFMWDSSFTDYDTRNLKYINQGHVEAPILVEMSGHLVNPKIELYVEGELYQTVAFTTEIAEYEKLLYGTKENDFYINKQNTDGTIESLFNLNVINFNNDNVIRLPKNKSCELKLTAENEVLNAQVTILAYYKAV